MTTATLPHKSTETPPEAARQAVYPMLTQLRPIRVTYMVDPSAFACAVLPEAAAILAHSGAGLAIKADAVGEGYAAALAHGVAPSGK